MSKRIMAGIWLLLLPLWLRAQGPTAEITGTVTDATGAVVSGAVVTLTNVATNVDRTSRTNEAGIYDAPSLLPGIYSLRVTLAGFHTAVSRIELQVSQIARMDFSLQVGNVNETVEVQAQAAELQTESTALGAVVENRRIEELPLNGRNYLQLAALVPGATNYGPTNFIAQARGGGDRSNFQLNIAGQRLEFNHYTLDGIENTDPNYGTYLVQPSVDALQEFKVDTSTYSAEYGHNVAQISVVSKSGTNEYHGTLFEFLRNSNLDAKNFYDKPNAPIAPFKRNQFGGVIGGPVVIPKVFDGRNKLFFFFNYEGLRQVKSTTSLSNVFNASDRTGNFGGSSTTIYDPDTRVLAADGSRVLSVNPFPGNVIPSNRISPQSAQLLNLYPLPNNNPTGYVNNFLSNETSTANNDAELARVDWQQNASSSFQFRYSHANEPQYIPAAIPHQGTVNTTVTHQALLGHTLVLGASKVNEFKVGFSRLESNNGNTHMFDPASDYVSKLGIPNVLDTPLFWGIPFIQISNFSSFGDPANGPYANWDTIFQWSDNFSWTHGTHSFKFGGEYQRTRYNLTGNDVARGRFTFSGQYSTQVGAAPAAQNAIADYLLGSMSNAEGQLGQVVAMLRGSSTGLYFQDQWKVTPKLTVNYGFRYEIQPGYSEKYNHVTSIDIDWKNGMFPTWVRLGTGDFYEGYSPFHLPPGIPTARDGRFGNTIFRTDYKNFGPRLGFAYSVTPKTVIRAGAGIYYVHEMGNTMFDVARNMPFTLRIAQAANALTPNETWTSPFPVLGVSTLAPDWLWKDPTSYVPQWSFTLQRQLATNMSLEAAYVGSSGVHLGRTTYYNEPPPGPPTANINLRRPFPQLGFVQLVEQASHSSYDALQVRLQQRFSHGFSVLSSFTWQKSIDNGSGVRNVSSDSYTPQDVNNLRAERGLSAFNFGRGWVTSALWELPVGRGKTLLKAASRLADAVVGGWQLGGIFTWSSGFPFSVNCTSGSTYQNTDTPCRADATGISPSLSNPTPNVWFNKDAFVSRTGFVAGVGPYRFGNSGRNVVVGPGVAALDFSMQKVFRITEKSNLQFRAEFFNLPNHPIFNLPGMTVGTVSYGVISSTHIDSRQIQFGLKLRF
jgi:hypothetical protein